MRKKFIYILMLVPVFCVSAAYADKTADAGRLFEGAGRAYKENKYDDAIALYDKILGQGLESGSVYYNLGNCYVKKALLGKALLYYERASLLMPDDSDLRANYEYVRSRLDLPRERLFGNRLIKAVDKICETVSADTLALILSLFYTLFFAALILRVLAICPAGFCKWFVMVAAAVTIISAAGLYRKGALIKNGAVTISREADVKFEPFESGTTYFKITEGSLVEVLEKSGDWCKIRRPDGRSGWVRSGEIERLSI